MCCCGTRSSAAPILGTSFYKSTTFHEETHIDKIPAYTCSAVYCTSNEKTLQQTFCTGWKADRTYLQFMLFFSWWTLIHGAVRFAIHLQYCWVLKESHLVKLNGTSRGTHPKTQYIRFFHTMQQGSKSTSKNEHSRHRTGFRLGLSEMDCLRMGWSKIFYFACFTLYVCRS